MQKEMQNWKRGYATWRDNEGHNTLRMESI